MSSVRRQRAALPGRISIIGVPGAGKTSLARAILSARPAPHINADAYIWEPNWTLRGPDPNAEFRTALRRKRAWIADGCVLHGPKELLELPELVIYLDYSAPRLVLHNLKRWLVHRRSRRAELPAGCEERFPLAILRGVLRGGYRPPRGGPGDLSSPPPGQDRLAQGAARVRGGSSRAGRIGMTETLIIPVLQAGDRFIPESSRVAAAPGFISMDA